MQIDNEALVMVVDGAKMLLFRNKGDAEYPNLEVEEALTQDDEATREQGSSAPGRNAAPGGSRKGAFEQTDFHQQSEDRFAAEAAAMLNKRALANDYEKLIIVAPPNTLGELRKHYHKALQSRLTGEIGKDLASHPVAEIERLIVQA
jgi:protein required for attachment to host cells